jgi:hypothetical protein
VCDSITIEGVANVSFLICRMSQYQEDTRDDVLKKAEKLQTDGWESYLNPWAPENLSGDFCFLSLLCDGPQSWEFYAYHWNSFNLSLHNNFVSAKGSWVSVADTKNLPQAYWI